MAVKVVSYGDKNSVKLTDIRNDESSDIPFIMSLAHYLQCECNQKKIAVLLLLLFEMFTFILFEVCVCVFLLVSFWISANVNNVELSSTIVFLTENRSVYSGSACVV